MSRSEWWEKGIPAGWGMDGHQVRVVALYPSGIQLECECGWRAPMAMDVTVLNRTVPDHFRDIRRKAGAVICDSCGSLDWTIERYGRVTHKQACPHRAEPWHQGDPQA